MNNMLTALTTTVVKYNGLDFEDEDKTLMPNIQMPRPRLMLKF